jgi:hypothetical protein
MWNFSAMAFASLSSGGLNAAAGARHSIEGGHARSSWNDPAVEHFFV